MEIFPNTHEVVENALNKRGEAEPNEEAVRNQLTRILEAPEFAGSNRLQSLLRFVVDHGLDHPGQVLRAKTIGIDLYGYGARDLEKRSTSVRVDVGRVRKKLEEYYLGEGAGDPIVIALPKGSYAPSFTWATDEPKKTAAPGTVGKKRLDRAVLYIGILLCAIGLGLATWSIRSQLDEDVVVGPSVENEQLSAVFEDSPRRLRAINLAQSGRGLIFPAVDPERLVSALQLFDFAIAEDPEYFGGYAGAAQVHATMALLAPEPAMAAEHFEAATINSNRAKYLAPGAAWSLSAQAWLDFAQGNHNTALRLSERAIRGEPNDHHLVEFDALISLFSGEFERVKTQVQRIRPQLRGQSGFVFTNALGSVYFHEGNPKASIEEFERSISEGGPTGPISMIYLIAAHFLLGETERAGQLAEAYRSSFGNRRADLLLSRLYRNPTYGEDLSRAVANAGLTFD